MRRYQEVEATDLRETYGEKDPNIDIYYISQLLSLPPFFVNMTNFSNSYIFRDETYFDIYIYNQFDLQSP